MRPSRHLLWTALALLCGLALCGGCGSDSVAPHDQLPALTEEDSANQAALVALAVAKVGVLTVDFISKAETYTFPPGSDVQGSVLLDYRSGGAGGAVAEPDEADYVRATTISQEGFPGVVVVSPLGGEVWITADVMADIDQGPPASATILDGSAGTMTAGDFSATFVITGLTVTKGEDYPTGGPVTFDNGTHVLTFSFDGTATVTLALDDEDRWTFDLDTLELDPILTVTR